MKNNIISAIISSALMATSAHASLIDSPFIVDNNPLVAELAHDDLNNNMHQVYLSNEHKLLSDQLTKLGNRYGFSVSFVDTYLWLDDIGRVSRYGNHFHQAGKAMDLFHKDIFNQFITKAKLGRIVEGHHSLHERTPTITSRDSQGVPKSILERLTPLAEELDRDIHKTHSVMDSGNILVGKRDNGDTYAIVGRDVVLQTSLTNNFNIKAHPYPEELIQQQIIDADYSEAQITHFYHMFKSSSYYSEGLSDAELIILSKRFLAMNDISRALITAELGLNEKDVIFISQPDYLVTMALRPLSNGKVLMQSTEDVTKALQRELRTHRRSIYRKHERLLISSAIENSERETRRRKNINKRIIRQLQEAGLKVIPVPSLYTFEDNQGITKHSNFINGIMGTSDNGEKYYITTASSIKRFNKLFYRALKKAEPDINIHFIGQKATKYDINYAEKLADSRGGLDAATMHHE